MKKTQKTYFKAIIIIVAIFSFIQAQTKPIQLSLITPVQLVDESKDIVGIRLNLIYGRNSSVTGVDAGFINHSTDTMSYGYQVGFIGLIDADFMGWQNNGLNFIKGTMYGHQAGFYNYSYDIQGLQFGFVNYTNSMEGLQFGLINYANRMKGIQIGIINIIKQDGTFPIFPIVNWSF